MNRHLDFTEKELINYIMLKGGVKVKFKTVEHIYRTLRAIMIEELERNGRIKLDGIGTFHCMDVGGKDKTVRGLGGVYETKYVERRKAIRFSPATMLTNCVNAEVVMPADKKTMKKKSKRRKPKDKEVAFMTNMMENQPTMFELLRQSAEVKNKKFRKKQLERQRQESEVANGENE